MRPLKLLLTVLLALGLTIGTTFAAQADTAPIDPEVGGGYASLDFADFRYPGSNCYGHTGYLEVYSDDDYAYDDWTAEIDIYVSRDGQYVDGFFDTKDFSGTYTLDALLCRGVDPTGTYEVTGQIDFNATRDVYDPTCDCTYPDYITRTVYLNDTFVVRAPLASTLTATKSAYGAHGWKVAGAARYDGRNWVNKRVYFQVYRNGAWRTITSKATNSLGRVNFYYTPAAGTAKSYRLLTTASNGVPTKATPRFYLRRR